jgi:ankyrin repeat protein
MNTVGAVITIVITLSTANLQAGEIHEAAAVGDLNRVRTLLEADPTLLESTDDFGRTPLNKACERKQVAIATFLIEKGADVKTKDKMELTPLHYAADVDLIKRLVAKGADVNARNGLGFSPLSLAIGGAT